MNGEMDKHTLQRDTIFNASPWIQKLYALVTRMSTSQVILTSALPSISIPSASLKELILTNGVFPMIIHEKRSNVFLPKYFYNIPISPETPFTTSSLLNSMGRGVKSEISRSFLRR